VPAIRRAALCLGERGIPVSRGGRITICQIACRTGARVDERLPTGRCGPPIVIFALAASFVGAYLYYLTLNSAQQEQMTYAFAVIPARFDPASPMHFANWYEALGPLLGHVFLHGGWLHLGMNTLVYMQGAPWVASRLGAARFLLLFFISAIGGALVYILINLHSENFAVGASGAICGVFGAYFLSVGRSWGEALANPGVRNGIGMFLLINVGLAGLASASGFLPIAWEAHLGGFVTGALAYLVLAPRVVRGPWG
jgi:membrane associated rhomboid family serine protease